MIKLQNLPQLVALNYTPQAVSQRNVAINSNLERSPQCDCVSFTGKKEEPEELLPIVEVSDDDIVVIPDEDVEVVDDSAYIYDLDLAEENKRQLEAEEEEERRRRDEDEQFNNDIFIYGVFVPEMIVEDEIIARDAVLNDMTDDTVNPAEDDSYSQNDDFSSFNDSFNDFDDYGF